MLRGQARAVGSILTGTPFTVGAREGDRLAVTVSDPDVDWADGVTLAISMYDILGCTPP
jgi:acetamidase/formamidase